MRSKMLLMRDWKSAKTDCRAESMLLRMPEMISKMEERS